MIEVRRVTAAETRPLRQAVLRPHQRADELVFPGDESGAHFGGFLDGRMVTTASIFRARPPWEDDPLAWRLRGMATAPELRGRGFGAAVLVACLEHARSVGGSIVWCSARTGALAFYRRWGFVTCGDEFSLPEIGPHYFMWRTI
jgi:GNAT superfamily N-acetyltransferase